MQNNRRHLITVFGTFVTTLSGCSTLMDNGPSSFRIPEVTVVNKDTESHQFEIQIMDGGTLVFHQSGEVAGATYKDGSYDSVGSQTWTPSLEKSAHTLRARLGERDWKNMKFEDRATKCIRPEIQVNRQGEIVFVYRGCP